MRKHRRGIVVCLLAGAAILCLGLTETATYPLSTLRTIFLQRDGGNTLTGDTFTIANGAADNFTLQKTDGAGAPDGDMILKTDSTGNNSQIILDNDSPAGPQFRQAGVQVGQFAAVNPLNVGQQAFLVNALKLTRGGTQYLVAENLIISPDFTGTVFAPSVTVTAHSITGNPEAKLGSNSTDVASSLRVQGASVYYADPATVFGYGPKVDVFSAEATGPGTNFIAGDAGLQVDSEVSIRDTDATKAIVKFIRGTTIEWRIDSSANWVDVGTGNLVDGVDVGAHTHVGGGSNGANLGTDSVGATQIADSLCLGVSLTLVATPSATVTSYAPVGDSGGGLGSVVESSTQLFYGGPMTMHSLRAKVDTAPGVSKSWAITLRDDGADTSLTCTISGTATTCADTTHFPAIGAGSLLNWKIVPTSTPVAVDIDISVCTGQ